ncbi:MAG: DUF3857 domain-containing protein [Candidatus Eisenbacteria bacterium]|uniref:DUF3857 domain-containing protein n=1 Tax=Eiseniibacteriota bacterium TaxID=2212470 RepID=A0A933SFK0_UNCEI|nr:DUF3857 domain-containing protein [Candidatus Eisenbacteria bacterium]
MSRPSPRVAPRSLRARTLIMLCFAAALCLPECATAATDAPKLVPAEELLRLSAATPSTPSDPVQVLLDEVRLQFDAQGRVTRTLHLVYRIDSSDRADDWASVSRWWQPWLQARPSIEAQVMDPNGKVQVLDAAQLTESTPESDRSDTWSDARKLSAPLPGVRKGCVVEELSVLRDTAVSVPAGSTTAWMIGRGVPVAQYRMTVDLPEGVTLQHRVEKFTGLEIERARENGRLTVTYTASRLPRVSMEGDGEPGDVPRVPTLLLSTGTSWERVVSAYRALVEPRLAQDPGHAAIAAFAAEVRKAAGARASREALVEAANRRLHPRVRYTGVELGAASIIPAYPSVTLERGYGDCKDKSFLLVALLRELGVPAELALLNTGPGRDVHPELPGWGIFDHAIVRVAGKTDLWVDATDATRRAGQLPPMDQDRLALPIHEGSRELVRIPLASPSDNAVREWREVTLPELGPARFVERSELRGAPEAEYRESYGDMTPDKLQESLQEYARNTYLAEGRARIAISDPQDFSKPFELTVTVDEGSRAETELEQAWLYIPRTALFSRLPDAMTSFEQDSLDHPAYSGVRKTALLLLDATVMEHRYTIVPPPGFLPDGPPEPVDVELGPCRFSARFDSEPSGTVTGRILFDPRVTRLSADEVNAFRKAYRDLLRTNMLRVSFRQSGLAKIDKGELLEGVNALRLATEKHPESAVAHMRLALGLRTAGMGDAARAEARTATRLAPGEARLFDQLGEILSSDVLGRPHASGWDREGAIAAYRRAFALDSTLKRARAGIALSLEFDSTGARYRTGADLEQALEIYRALGQDELNDLGIGTNLPALMLHMGRFAELEKWTRGYRGSTALGYRITAIAARGDIDAAIAESRSVDDSEEERRQALANASANLLMLGRYADAGRLVRASSRGQENAAELLAQADMLSRLRPYVAAAEESTSARALARRLFGGLLSLDSPGEWLSGFLSSRLRDTPEDPTTDIEGTRATMRRLTQSSGLALSVYRDLVMGLLVVKVEGDSTHAARLGLSAPGAGEALTLYAVKEASRWRLAGTGGDQKFKPEAAWWALVALERGDEAGARQWLRWRESETGAGNAYDSLVSQVFHAGNDAGDRLPLVIAAGLAQGDSATCVRALETEAKLVRGPDWGEREARLRLSLRAQAALGCGRLDSALVYAKELEAADPASTLAFAVETGARLRRQDLAGARAVVDSYLRLMPQHFGALQTGRTLAVRAEDWRSYRRFATAMASQGGSNDAVLNDWAWFDVFRDDVTDSTLERVHTAVRLAGKPEAGLLHTQAAVYTELGQLREARDVLVQYVEATPKSEIDDNAWYVIGRMAEKYGLRDAARDAYRRIRPNRTADEEVGSCHALAQRRLATLTGGAAGATGSRKK